MRYEKVQAAQSTYEQYPQVRQPTRNRATVPNISQSRVQRIMASDLARLIGVTPVQLIE